jgi:prophage regulatory protein
MVTPQSRTRRASSAGTEDRTGDTRPSMTQATRLLRLPAVREATGLGPTKLYELIGAGQFPRPVVLARTCSGKPRTVAWPEHEVRAWVTARIAERDARLGSGNESSKDAGRKRSESRDRTSTSRT